MNHFVIKKHFQSLKGVSPFFSAFLIPVQTKSFFLEKKYHYNCLCSFQSFSFKSSQKIHFQSFPLFWWSQDLKKKMKKKESIRKKNLPKNFEQNNFSNFPSIHLYFGKDFILHWKLTQSQFELQFLSKDHFQIMLIWILHS